VAVRAFSSAAEAHDEEPVEEGNEEDDKVSNAYKNQHIRYVPPKRFVFDVNTCEGRMTKILESDYSKLVIKSKMFNLATSVSFPGVWAASHFLPYG